jgi:hypothetical protein
MKRFGFISAAILLLSMGGVVSAYSLQEKQEEKAPPAKQQAPPKQQAQPKQQPQPKPQAQPKQQAQQKPAAQPKQQAQPKEQPAAAKSQPTRTPSATPKTQPATAKNQPARTPAATPKTQPVKTQPAPTKSQPSTTRTQQTGGQQSQQHVVRTSAEVSRQRSAPALRLSARGEGRIPDDRFRANFGRDHNFRIGSPVMVGGYSRFQYGGFWFGFVEPWPSGWYYTDDVYIDYVDGGYYMFNPYYPGARVSISVVI